MPEAHRRIQEREREARPDAKPPTEDTHKDTSGLAKECLGQELCLIRRSGDRGLGPALVWGGGDSHRILVHLGVWHGIAARLAWRSEDTAGPKADTPGPKAGIRNGILLNLAGGGRAFGVGKALGRQIGPGVALKAQQPEGAVGEAHARLSLRFLSLCCGNYSCKLASELQPKIRTACQIWQHGHQHGVHTGQPPFHRRGRQAKQVHRRRDRVAQYVNGVQIRGGSKQAMSTKLPRNGERATL